LRVIDFTTTQCLLFSEIISKPAAMQFDQRQGSSDGGSILLKAAEQRYGSIGGLAGCLRPQRQAGKADHPPKELLAQRVFSIACGYANANSPARPRRRPGHKMLDQPLLLRPAQPALPHTATILDLPFKRELSRTAPRIMRGAKMPSVIA
jgi:hypothetical protein